MNKICTSIEQSKKLMELGIDVKTADMFWKNGVSDKYIQCFTPFVSCGTNMDYDYDIPAWSLAALLELIPNYVINKADDKIYANLYYGLKSSHDNLVDAAFEMIKELHELKML